MSVENLSPRVCLSDEFNLISETSNDLRLSENIFGPVCVSVHHYAVFLGLCVDLRLDIKPINRFTKLNSQAATDKDSPIDKIRRHSRRRWTKYVKASCDTLFKGTGRWQSLSLRESCYMHFYANLTATQFTPQSPLYRSFVCRCFNSETVRRERVRHTRTLYQDWLALVELWNGAPLDLGDGRRVGWKVVGERREIS